MSARVVVSCICGLVIITVCVVVRLWRRTVCTLSCMSSLFFNKKGIIIIIYIGVCGSYLCSVPESLPMLAIMFSKVTEGDNAVDSYLVNWKSSIVSWVSFLVGRDLKICLDRITKQVDDVSAELKRQYQKQEISENRAKAAQTNRENKGKERPLALQRTLSYTPEPST